MLQDPFPDPDDGEDPDGSVPPDDEDGPGQQGLFLCLPPEQFDPDQFAQSGPAKDMEPGALMATILDAVIGEDGSGLPGLSEDQLIGMISGARRMASRSAWWEMAAVREFTRRHAGQGGRHEFAADELADELNLTWNSAAGQMDFACTVADRLPRTFAALGAGKIHPVDMRIIEEETRILSAEDAAKADAILAGMAGTMTWGKLRHAAHKLVLHLDPEAVRKRQEAAKRETNVRKFREDSGNAGMIARELAPDEALASWQHVEQRALDLRTAGVPGTLDELRVRAFLDLLQELDSRTAAAVPDEDSQPGSPADGDNRADGPGSGSGGSGPDDTGSDGPGGSGPGGSPADSGPTSGTGGGRQPGRDTGASLAALVNITIPWNALQHRSETPADVAGFGLVHAHDARDLIAAAARDPRTRWCVTGLHPDGTAAAHGCAHGRHPPPAGIINLAGTGTPAPGPDPPQDYLQITMTTIARGHCDHEHAETRYKPSRTLQHLIRVRNATCTAPGCSRPAARCDLDHTIAWDQGGLTCECGLAPLCRHHHRCKQAEGWQLSMPEPGVLVWHTPTGRSYTTTPTPYAL
jgi:Domain of unknown function (DUF222)